MTSPRQAPSEDRQRAGVIARNAARREAFTLARDDGAQIISRPAYRGSDRTVRDVEPLAGMQAARDLELGARQTAHDYIRRARETGHSWHQIGAALNLTPGGDAQQTGESLGEAAFTYAAGNPNSEYARRYGRSVSWTCQSCDRAIADHGLDDGPADSEHGHANSCQRLAATIAAWNAEWEAGG